METFKKNQQIAMVFFRFAEVLFSILHILYFPFIFSSPAAA